MPAPEPGHCSSISMGGSQGSECGGRGGRLACWWPVGVVVTMVPSRTWVAHPRDPWSGCSGRSDRCRYAGRCPHPGDGQGVVGVPDRRTAPRCSAHLVPARSETFAPRGGKSRRRASVAARSPVLGSVNNRRTHTRVCSSALTRSRATGAGIGPYPTSWAGSSSASARARSVITRCTSMPGTCAAPSRRGQHPAHEFVGHDLTFGAVLVGGGRTGHRGAVQFPEHRHPVLDRQQRGHVRHAVRRRPDRDPPIHRRLRRAVGGAVRVESLRPPPRFPFGAGIAPPGQLVGDRLIDLRAVLHRQVRRFPGDEGGPPLTGLTRAAAPPALPASRAPGCGPTRHAGSPCGGCPAGPTRPAHTPTG